MTDYMWTYPADASYSPTRVHHTNRIIINNRVVYRSFLLELFLVVFLFRYFFSLAALLRRLCVATHVLMKKSMCSRVFGTIATDLTAKPNVWFWVAGRQAEKLGRNGRIGMLVLVLSRKRRPTKIYIVIKASKHALRLFKYCVSGLLFKGWPLCEYNNIMHWPVYARRAHRKIGS